MFLSTEFMITLGQLCKLVPICTTFGWIGPTFAGTNGAQINDCYLKDIPSMLIKISSTTVGVVSGMQGCIS